MNLILAPLLTSSLLPLKMVLQARFRGRDPSKRRAGLHSSRLHTLSGRLSQRRKGTS